MDNKDYRLAVLGKMLEMAEKHCFEDEIGFLYDRFIPLAKGVANIDSPCYYAPVPKRYAKQQTKPN